MFHLTLNRCTQIFSKFNKITKRISETKMEAYKILMDKNKENFKMFNYPPKSQMY